MRFSAPLLTVAGLAAGTAAAVVAYQAAAATGPATKPASVSTQEPAPAAATTTWLPCEHGWKLKGTTCVRIQRKVVVVHDLPAQAAAPATTAGVRAPAAVPTGSTVTRGTSQHTEHGDQNEVEHAGTSEDTQDVSEPDQPDHEDVGGDD